MNSDANVVPPNQCKCRKTVRANQKSLKCDACETRYHCSCLSLDSNVEKVYLDSVIAIPWLCGDCVKSIPNLRSENKRLHNENDELKKMNKNLVEKVNAIESQIGLLKNEIKDELLTELRMHDRPEPSYDLQKQISLAIREENLKTKKALNLCVSGLPRSGLHSNDVADIADICQQNMNIDSSEIRSGISQSFRVGKSDENRPQLLILTFKTAELKRKILSNSFKLKDYTTANGRKIFVSPDFTPKQREENTRLVEELKSRRAHGEHVKIKNGSIVRVSSNINSQPN